MAAQYHERKYQMEANSIAGELLLITIFDKMIEGVQIIGFDWRHIYVNDAIVKQSGYRKEDLIGYTMMEKYPGIETTPVFDVLKECMETRASRHTEIDFVFPDKRHAWFELSIQPVKEGIFVLSIDITARKETEQKLRASEMEYRSLIEQATDGIFISDQHGNYVDVNVSACRMVGYSKEELLTMKAEDLLPQDELKEKPPRYDLLRSGKTLLVTRNYKRKDGTIIPVEINAKMLSNGKILGMVRDISKRKNAEKKIKATEAKFRRLTETAFDAIVLMNEAGNIIFWNRGAELIFGYRKEEVLQNPLTMIMPGEYRHLHEKGLKQYLDTGIPHVIGKVVSLQGMRKNGEIFPIEVSITTWESAGNRVFSGIIRDSSERKLAEDKILRLNQTLEEKVEERTAELENKIRQLRDSEEKFQKAFQASAAGISITRMSDASLVDVNDAFARMTGFSRDELIGKSPIAMGIVANDNELAETTQRMRANGFVRDFEMTLRTKSGQALRILASIETIWLNEEQFALTIFYDITERKKSEEQLEAVNKELEAFSYSVSHDLRAPLRAIIGYTEVLEEDLAGKLDDSTKQVLTTIQKNGARMNKLIDDLLRFSKLGKKGLQKTEVVTEAVVTNCLNLINNASQYSARVIINRLFNVQADPEMISQVWFNLISNAFKYSSKKVHPQIEIGAEKSDHEIVFYVKDNGTGFDIQYADKLFGVFQRLHRPDEFEGTGVGLSIVKRIVLKHGGRVWAEAKKGEGATFYFSLPHDQGPRNT